jgi:hypothetical protein
LKKNKNTLSITQLNFACSLICGIAMKQMVFLLLLLISQPGVADWTLNNKASNFNYFSLKNKNIEVNSFSNMSGTISDQGKLNLKIDLSSIDTNNSNKNLMIQDLFLETKDFQEAELSLPLGSKFIDSLELSKATQMPVQGSFVLHGITQQIDLILLITRLKHNFLLIKTFEPVLLKLKDFGFADEIVKLRSLKDFKSITNTVPISFNLFFTSI